MRSQVVSALSAAISTLTQFAMATELPWSQNGQPLYLKNMKKVYVDATQVEQTTLIPTLNGGEVFENLMTSAVYVSVDAKNQPSQLDALITNILNAKNSINLINFGLESDYTVEKLEDVMLLTFEFRLQQATL